MIRKCLFVGPVQLDFGVVRGSTQVDGLSVVRPLMATEGRAAGSGLEELLEVSCGWSLVPTSDLSL